MVPRPTTRHPPLVSVILSFRDEEAVLPELIQQLQQVFAHLSVESEWVFVNDASTDRSLRLLVEHAQADSRVKIINMSRRFGVAECFLAGMRYARGDAVITMDTDLQDPPQVIPELLKEWQRGAEVVYTVRTQREGEPVAKLWLTRLAYKAIQLVANEKLPVEAGDFKLIGRRVVNELLKLNEKDPYLRGLVSWMGFKQVPVYYKRAPRAQGKTHFPIFRSKGPLATFVFGFTSFSILPLVAFLVLGALLTLVSLLSIPALAAAKFLAIATPKGLWLLIALGFFAGLQLTGIGMLGLYLGRVYIDVRNRPRYIVESTIGFEPTPADSETVGEMDSLASEKRSD